MRKAIHFDQYFWLPNNLHQWRPFRIPRMPSRGVGCVSKAREVRTSLLDRRYCRHVDASSALELAINAQSSHSTVIETRTTRNLDHLRAGKSRRCSPVILWVGFRWNSNCQTSDSHSGKRQASLGDARRRVWPRHPELPIARSFWGMGIRPPRRTQSIRE